MRVAINEYFWDMHLRKTWKYHLLLAIIIEIMEYFSQYVYGGRARFIGSFEPGLVLLRLTYLITFFSVYFLNYLVVCPRTLSKKNVGRFLLAILFMPFVFAGIRYFLDEIVVYNLFGFHNYHESKRVLWYYVFDNSYYTTKALLFSTSMYLLFMYLRNLNRIHQLELENKKAELNFLKTKLEPHFLFNTLNTFYSELIDSQPKTAKSIHKLSELLRYVTYEANKDFMPLKAELKFIEDYIYFYKKRYESNLFIDYKVEGTVTDNHKIPTLILIHFLENLFKHGIYNDKKNPAEFTITINETDLILKSKNKISNGQNYSDKGIGRDNLIKRLDLLFEDTYKFRYDENNIYFETYLKFPITNK